jgi:hypothetical protein
LPHRAVIKDLAFVALNKAFCLPVKIEDRAGKGLDRAHCAYLNTLGPDSLQTNQGNNDNTTVATLTVAPANTGATPIPTLNEWGLIIFMALAGLGSISYLRKQKEISS